MVKHSPSGVENNVLRENLPAAAPWPKETRFIVVQQRMLTGIGAVCSESTVLFVIMIHQQKEESTASSAHVKSLDSVKRHTAPDSAVPPGTYLLCLGVAKAVILRVRSLQARLVRSQPASAEVGGERSCDQAVLSSGQDGR